MMARNPSIYTGLCQGAATRRNRALRAARRYQQLLRKYPFGSIPTSEARGLLTWEFQIECVWQLSNEGAAALAIDLIKQALKDAIARVRRNHRDWKVWSQRNRQWRSEMAAIEKRFA